MNPSEASRHTAATPTRLRAAMRQRPLFFFLAYAFSWIISIPYVLSSWGILPSGYNLALLLFALKYAGPTVAAIIMTSAIEWKRGLLRLWPA